MVIFNSYVKLPEGMGYVYAMAIPLGYEGNMRKRMEMGQKLW